MKLSKRTLEILHNFVMINDSLIIKPGNTLATKAIAGNIIAQAEVEETFPQEFAIYNLAEFLAVVSLFDDPELEFIDNLCTISEGGNKVIYAAGNPDIIRNNPPASNNLPDFDVNFKLALDDFKQIKKASAVLAQDLISFLPDDNGNLIARTSSSTSTNTVSGNHFDTQIGLTDLKGFQAVFALNTLVMIDQDYDVGVSSKGIAQYEADDIVYWLTLWQTSHFAG